MGGELIMSDARRKVQEEAARIEREKLEKQHAELQAAQLLLEEERLAEQQRKHREEVERQAMVKAEEDAKELEARREQMEAERLAKEAEEENRLEALRPDTEKLKSVIDTVRSIELPDMVTSDGQALAGLFRKRIDLLADHLLQAITHPTQIKELT